MRLFIVVGSLLSLLAISNKYAHAAAVVGYPYRTELLAYRPARGEFPVVNSLANGYVRYVDKEGVQHVVGYKYPEPVQSRRITNEEYLKQLIKGSLHKDESERNKAREEHFRLWSVNQYEQYRQEIERLKSANQEPSADLLAKTKIFEDIVIATRRGAISEETPQLKQVREEHLRTWNAGREAAASAESVSGVNTKQQTISAIELSGAVKQPEISLRLQSISDAAVVPVAAPAQVVIIGGETVEQKKAREEHLRIYQEQLQRVQQAQAEAAAAAVKVSSQHGIHQTKDTARSQYGAHQNVVEHHHVAQQSVHPVEQVSYVHETPEVQRAKAEHLRLWQEAKARAEKEEEHNAIANADKHIETKNIAYKPEQQIGYTMSQQQQTQNFIQQTNSKYEEALKQQQLTDSSDTVSILSATQSADKYQEKIYGHQHQQHQHQQQLASSFAHDTEHSAKLPTPVEDTPEVQRARAEHLKILEELQKKAQTEAQITHKISSDAISHQTNSIQPKHHYTPTTTTTTTTVHTEQGGNIASKAISDIVHQQQVFATVQDTAEVQRAREEHLKLLKEAHLKANQYQTENKLQTYESSLSEDKPASLLIQNKETEEEARLRLAEAKLRETERLAEEARLREEQRLLAEEQQRLQMEEKRRLEQERLEQARLEQERIELAANEKKKYDENNAERPQLPLMDQLSLKPMQADGIERSSSSHQVSDNSHLLRFGGATAGGTPAIGTTTYLIAGAAQQPAALQSQQPAQLAQSYGNSGYLYLRDINDGGYLKVEKPYVLQYIPNQQHLGGKDTTLGKQILTTFADKQYNAQIIPIAADSIGTSLPSSAAATPLIPIGSASASFAPLGASAAPIIPLASFAPSSSDAMSISYGNDPALAALEKATREHFRAHEIAIQQLQSSNEKQQATLKDCY